jgi:uncharacterized protein (DUF433 family)
MKAMPLTDALAAEPAPIARDDDGIFRVGGTRVRLESVLGAFKSGYVAEEILFKYPSLNLTDIYAVITYYLWHQKEIDAYLAQRSSYAEEIRRENEQRFPAAGIRERLLARRGK